MKQFAPLNINRHSIPAPPSSPFSYTHTHLDLALLMAKWNNPKQRTLKENPIILCAFAGGRVGRHATSFVLRKSETKSLQMAVSD